MTLSLFLLAAATPIAATQDIRIDHQGGATNVTYTARADVITRTIGSSAPNRTDARRCRWVADVVVERAPRDMPHLTRVVSREQHLSGNVPGACTGTNKAVSRDIAAQQNKVESHLASVAETDGKLLLAEINAARALASN